MYERLSDLEKTAVAEVAHSDRTTFDSVRFKAKYGALPKQQFKHYHHYYASEDHFGQSLLPLFLYDGQMPTALKEELKAFVPRPPGVEIATVEELPAAIRLGDLKGLSATEPETIDGEEAIESLTVYETVQPALHEVVAVLRLVDAGKLSVSEKTRRATLAGLRAVHEVLYAEDFADRARIDSAADCMRPFAWPLLIQAAKLTTRSGTKLKLSPSGKKALQRPPQDTIRIALDAWVGTDLLDEFSRMDEIKGQTGRGKRHMSKPAERRKRIIEALCRCPAGRWIEIDQFFRYQRAVGLNFYVTSDPWHLYIYHPEYGSLGYDGSNEFEIIQGRYILAFFMEYLATLGILDIACIPPDLARRDFGRMWGTDDMLSLSRYDGLNYFRINELGAYCLGRSGSFVPPDPEPREIFTVMPNLEVAVSRAQAGLKSDLLFLSRFAEQASDDVWRLSRTSILAAVEEGLSVGEITEFLTANSSGELPGTVQRLLVDAQERARMLTSLGRAGLIQVADPATARLIAGDTGLGKLCLLAGERCLVVKEGDESQFRRKLKELGFVYPR